jgi:hypothetical protein
MARTEAQYREVADIANDLYAAGIKDPSAQAIRKILVERRGKSGVPVGSPNSLQDELMRWRSTERPADPATPAPQLAASVVAEINKSLEAVATRARDSLQPQLEMISQELKEVVEGAKLCEIQLEEMTALLAQRTRERDIAEGQTLELTALSKALRDTIEQEQTHAATLRVDLVRAEYSAAAEVARAAEAKERELILRDEIVQIRAHLSIVYESQIKAERQSEVAAARLESEVKARSAVEARIDELLSAVQGIAPAAARASAAEASAVELRAQVAMLQALLAAATAARPIRISQPAGTAGRPASVLPELPIAREAAPTISVGTCPPLPVTAPIELQGPTVPVGHLFTGDSERVSQGLGGGQ